MLKEMSVNLTENDLVIMTWFLYGIFFYSVENASYSDIWLNMQMINILNHMIHFGWECLWACIFWECTTTRKPACTSTVDYWFVIFVEKNVLNFTIYNTYIKLISNKSKNKMFIWMFDSLLHFKMYKKYMESL